MPRLQPRRAQALAAAIAAATSVAEASEPPRQQDGPADEQQSDDGLDIGGFGGLGVRYARLLERNTGLVCAELAVLFEHRFSLGTGGCTTWLSADAAEAQDQVDGLLLNFGGTIVRYHLMPDRPIDASLGITAGVGSIDLEKDGALTRTDSLVVVEPEVAVHTFVADWMRLSAVGAYRMVSGVDTGGITSGDVSGFSVGVNAHFGWF